MNPILRNVLAVIAGLFVGGLVNGGLVSISPSIIPLPEGVDPNDMESLKSNMHLFQPKNFIMPFLAHALGALIGAFVAAKIAASHGMKLALGVGAFFLLGGIYMATALGAPMWVNAIDLLLAYIPMGWLGGKLARK